ncbi:MAG: flagellar motor switch protein FliN [Candidatus Eremiobacteraeota bacterium]|nr:flagellar motor switch protein FliN [Candidatus Eremiobacteraeota bacterium]
MPDINILADSMLGAAGTVLGRLVEMPVAASGATRNDHAGSIRVDGANELVTLAHIPSLAIGVVVRFNSGEIARIVNLMLGGGDEAAEMGAMQLSIVSETVSQIAVAMSEQLAREIGASTDGIRAELCNDATMLPPPPFESYEGMVQVGSEVAPQIAIDFDGIAVAKISGSAQPVAVAAAPPAPKVEKTRAPQPPVDARSVSFAPMTPTPQRGSAGSNLDLVHDVPLQISAVLGRTALALRDVVALQTGSVFELDKLSSEPIDLYVNNILIARGEVVVVDDKFAVKISELNPQVG